MVFRAATDADADVWQALLGRLAWGDFLHDWAWAAVAAFDGEPQRRYVVEEDGELTALAAPQERRLVGGRTFWYVPHGPVLDYHAPGAAGRLRAVIDGLRDAGREHRALAVKLEPRVEAGSGEAAAFATDGVRRVAGTLQVGQTRIVELGDDDALLAGFDKDTRYAVRRSEREGVAVAATSDAGDLRAIDALHQLVGETQHRAGFPLPPLARYRTAWSALAGAGRASIFEARREGRLLAAAMLVLEGERSFYLFSGSHREAAGETKLYASYALQWAMMRHARERGARFHDLWGVAPPNAGPGHAWYGVGLFKKGFGGREVVWAGSWDIVVDPRLYRLRETMAALRRPISHVRQLIGRGGRAA
jgi:peptidoglycan pentaglycine glycine transferase (the first glycine)